MRLGSAAAAQTQKFFDSRTFTRPKKKLLQYPADFEPPTPGGGGISPQVGGLVLSTPFSMQRSLINDVSPPSSLASSSVSYDCGNSLITSGDFSNISCLLNGMDGSAGLPDSTFMRMNSLRRSRFAHRLADFDETKDNSIAKTDMHGIDGSGSENSTLQNSVEGDATFVAKSGNTTIAAASGPDKTFNKNNTFDAVGTIADQTFTQLAVDLTFETTPSTAINATFTPPNISPTEPEAFESPVIGKPLPQPLVQSTPSVRGTIVIQVSLTKNQ